MERIWLGVKCASVCWGGGARNGSRSYLFLDGEEAHDVVVVEFAQNLELAHLDGVRPHLTHRVEHLHSVQLARFLSQDNTQTFHNVTVKLNN